MGSNTCMFSSIALLETTRPLASLPRQSSCDSLEWAGSVGASLATPGSIPEEEEEEDFETAPIPSKSTDDEEDSCESFTEEFNRAERKGKIVTNEIKHIMGKVLPRKKLLGREKEEAETKLKRAEGCLT